MEMGGRFRPPSRVNPTSWACQVSDSHKYQFHYATKYCYSQALFGDCGRNYSRSQIMLIS